MTDNDSETGFRPNFLPRQVSPINSALASAFALIHGSATRALKGLRFLFGDEANPSLSDPNLPKTFVSSREP